MTPTKDGSGRSFRLDHVDVAGLILVTLLTAWLAASATRSGAPVGGTLGPLAVGVAAYAVARLLRRFGRWQASLAVALAVLTIGLRDPTGVLDRLEGPLGYANATAALAVLGAVHAAIVARSVHVRWARRAATTAATVLAAVPWLNGSRAGAVLTLLLLIPIALPRPRPHVVRGLSAVAAIGVVTVIGVTTVAGAVFEEQPESSVQERVLDATVSERRLELWHDAVALTFDDPVRGVGVGRFDEESPTARRYPDQGWAHHEYLQLAAETGVVGGLLLIALVIWGFVRTGTRPGDLNALFVIAGWAAVATHASLDYVLHFPAVIAAAGALLGASSRPETLPWERRRLPDGPSRAEEPARDDVLWDTPPGTDRTGTGHLSLSPAGTDGHARRRETSKVRHPGPVGEEWVMGAGRWVAEDADADSSDRNGVPVSDTPGGPLDRATDAVSGRVLASARAAAVRMRLDYALVALDATLIVAAYAGALLLRFDGSVPDPFASRAPRFFAMALIAHLLANGLAGLYGHVWQQASIDEARRVVVANTMASVWLLVWVSALPSERAPLTVVIVGGALSLLLTGVVRFRTRLFAFQIGRSSARGPDARDRVLVVGTGVAARGVISEMREAEASAYRPVAVLDPDPTHHGRTILSLPVVGGLDVLPRAADEHRADLVLIADPDLDRGDVEDVVSAARDSGLDVKVLPNVTELMGQTATVRDVRDLAITDLLGRRPIPTDLDAIRGILAGKRVLVTGGGGSIGSELARQISACGPEQLILLDHDETHLYDAVARLGGGATQVLADVRDAARIDRVLALMRPEIIFHAAAHKHVPILETYPAEAVATNVLGTQNLIRSARVFGVERFVFISTDKAVNPRSVMGATKRLGEQLVLQADGQGSTRFCAVRFGNVLGSRGSVIPTFVEQIRRGGPVTVTHPDMTRFFMTIPEATQLVLQAAAFSDGGDIFMLDMGDPVRIVDLADRMIRLSGQRPDVDVRITYTGLRPGEKLAEELAATDEEGHPTPHPSIEALEPTLVDPRALRDGVEHLRLLTERHADDDIVRLLFDLTGAGSVDDGPVIVLPEVDDVVTLPLAQAREASS